MNVTQKPLTLHGCISAYVYELIIASSLLLHVRTVATTLIRVTLARHFFSILLEATLPFYQIIRLRYYVYLVTVIPLISLFASQHCRSTFTYISTVKTQMYYIEPHKCSLLWKLSYTYSNLYTCIHYKCMKVQHYLLVSVKIVL